MIIFIGAPGSGKGTQADYLEMYTGRKHISTGDIARAERTPEQAARMDAGENLSSEEIFAMLSGYLGKLAAQGIDVNNISLDGLPRDAKQAALLIMMAPALHLTVEAVVAIDGVPPEELAHRMEERERLNPRGDASPESIAKRLELDRETRADTLAFLRANNVPIVEVNNGDDTRLAVYNEMAAGLTGVGINVQQREALDEIAA